MAPALTFIIPVRHQANAKNWAQLKGNLSQTLRSLSQQTNPNWKAIIVANYGADLPELPPRVEVAWVDFAPNPLHEKGVVDQETFYDAFRIDKGRRVLSGMLQAGKTRYFMIVDDDDFVSRKMTQFVIDNDDANGWYVDDGYIWQESSSYLYRYSGFSKLCGTSHVIRSDLYQLPKTFEEASEEYIKRMLGSHIFIDKFLREAGTPLSPLPFAGAVYRVGHPGAHSKSKGVFTQYFMHKWLLWSPGELARRLIRLKYLSQGLRTDFFG